MDTSVFVEMRHIHKSFSGVEALSDVCFSIRRGEIHAVCGENGAGKSTLVKILTGACEKDSGEIMMDGQAAEMRTPRHAIRRGVACVYQELSLVPTLDVATNLFLGNLPRGRFGLVSRWEMERRARTVLDRIGLSVPPRAPVSSLSLAQQQLVEIGRALTRNARLIILDEPTSALSEREISKLFSLMERLRAEGVSLLFISHRLNELLRVGDRVTVLRDGRAVTTLNAKDASQEVLMSHMIGRTLDDLYSKRRVKPQTVALSVQQLRREGAFRDISFDVRHGEVLGLFGLVGAGRTEIAEAIFGVTPCDGGRILVDGEEKHIRCPRDAIACGISLVPEDRRNSGLAELLSVLYNMTLPKLGHINTLGVIDAEKREELADQYVRSIHIKTPFVQEQVRHLSGGNQQKVVLSKWLMMHPKILILDEPTRGVDVGSRAEIYDVISALAAEGAAILLISSDLHEILGTCDRVITLFEGGITGNMSVGGVTRDGLLAAASGGDGA